jgi:uncharacterized protein (DUF2062 family)
MKDKTEKNSGALKFLHRLYEKLFKIHDSPQRIALGFGLGVFSGIIPGTGPLAALFLAFIFRANRASAILGSLLTNTWLSFITFILAIKTGSVILNIDWKSIRQDWYYFFQNFSWSDLFKISVLKIILPVIIGYFIIAVCLGLLAYLATFLVVILIRRKKIKAKGGANAN